MLYADMPAHEAMRHVRDAGADACEFWGSRGKDIGAIAAASRELELPVAAFCATLRRALTLPRAAEDIATDLERDAAVCDELACRRLIVISGPPVPGQDRPQTIDNIRRALEAAVAAAERLDLTLLLEPTNPSEGMFLNTSAEAIQIVRAIDNPHVRLLYDMYHMQLIEGNLTTTIRDNVSMVGHLHAADVPGRSAPGEGEINFLNVLADVEAAGYEGMLGLEYKPADNRESELADVIGMLRT
jgi:hydroxypyruvate isomerase